MAAILNYGTPFPTPQGTITDSILLGADVLAQAPAQNQVADLAPPFEGGLQTSLPTRLFKRTLDIVGSLILLVLLMPVLVAAAIAVAASGGPVLFCQPRVGLFGKTFSCYKFRSMVVDADRVLNSLLNTDPELRIEWQQNQKLKRDPRITSVGAFLRRTSIDELPQLWNVLLGDMSLVGPRPILVSQYKLYGRAAKWYASMRPGITGLWQVTSRGDGNSNGASHSIAFMCAAIACITISASC